MKIGIASNGATAYTRHCASSGQCRTSSRRLNAAQVDNKVRKTSNPMTATCLPNRDHPST